ncbi:hypothetical protein RJ53_10855 [Methanocalculus chunghsingensis]|uniref:BioF2-like acetyltransferase domain-containing protein n=1 Tax=Methanocalculus chunghsingensis TaxID=156457 RepID=A0A8J7WBZ0_9EURY|nr:GNAT family N-acetyltransferase [Methanocalculus chunghsingensis]MBR1369948.1 hypothetical protein [Methanocalculus chunghsingensis]
MTRDKYQARLLRNEEYPLWDTLVRKSPQGSIFSNSEYLQILADATNNRLQMVGCFEDNTLIGGCSLFVRKKRLRGTHAVSNGPDTPFCGFISQKADPGRVRKSEMEYTECINALCDYIENQNYSLISVTNSPELMDIRPFLRRGWRGAVAYTYYIDLLYADIDSFSTSVKKSILAAQKKNLVYEASKDAKSHCGILTEVFQHSHALPPFNETVIKRFLNFFHSNNSGDMRIIKDSSGNILASYIWLWDNNRAYAWSGGALPSTEFQDGGANKLMFYSFLEELKEKGLPEVNIMHGNTPRLTSFATGFNPRLVPYYIVERNSFYIRCLKGLQHYLNR